LQPFSSSSIAHEDPDSAFGTWEQGSDGEKHWVERPPAPDDIAARAGWKPDPAEPSSFDHLLMTQHGALDVVPEVSGTHEQLMPRALEVDVDGQRVLVESVEELLATLTVRRRAKDRDRVQQLRAIQRARDGRKRRKRA
jgi:hypothetical protein